MELGKVNLHIWLRVFEVTGTHEGMAVAIIKYQKVPTFDSEKKYLAIR